MLTILFILTTAAAMWTATHYRRKAIDARGERDVARDDLAATKYANGLHEWATAQWKRRCAEAQQAHLDMTAAYLRLDAHHERPAATVTAIKPVKRVARKVGAK